MNWSVDIRCTESFLILCQFSIPFTENIRIVYDSTTAYTAKKGKCFRRYFEISYNLQKYNIKSFDLPKIPKSVLVVTETS